MKPAVFINIEGILIRTNDQANPNDVRLMQGAASAIGSLCGLGYKVVALSNQSEIAQGKYKEEDVNAIHRRTHELVTQASNGAHIEGFYYCPYHPDSTISKYAIEHPTRLPAPGMIFQAAEDLDINLSTSWLIGSSMNDIQAGSAANIRTVLVHQDAEKHTPHDFAQPVALVNSQENSEQEKDIIPDFLSHNLVEAVRIIAKKRSLDHKPQKPAWEEDVLGPKPINAENTLSENSDDNPNNNTATQNSEKQKAAPLKTSSTKNLREKTIAQYQDTNHKTNNESNSATGNPEARTLDAAAYPPIPIQASGAITDSPSKEKEESSLSEEHTENDIAKDATESSNNTNHNKQDTLELILKELRSQRGKHNDFSYLNILAIVLQMIAGICLLGALFMGAHDAYLFVRWLGAGIIIQLATIATLLFARW